MNVDDTVVPSVVFLLGPMTQLSPSTGIRRPVKRYLEAEPCEEP